MKYTFGLCLALFLSLVSANSGAAQSNPFGNGWILESDASTLQFQSIKKSSVIETSSFAKISGEIDSGGGVSLEVLLDSVDTKVDLRNVRMRFLFFETFNYPTATVSAQITQDMIADLANVRRKNVVMPFSLDLHGVTKTLEAEISLTLIGDDLVAVSTVEPINLAVDDFNLLGGLEKLSEAANVDIVPSTAVSFDFIFRKSKTEGGSASAPSPEPTPAPENAALETEGDFSLEACVGRFEILSRTGNIYFAPGSSRLDQASTPLLDTVADIVSRCPDLTIQISGHTDSIGPNSDNQRLSETRAASVVAFLENKGISGDRMVSRGFGEDRPVADNSTQKGRGENRRIEFSVP
ncbi:MAG: OmpA family protein [Paracoccaceae bacterium]